MLYGDLLRQCIAAVSRTTHGRKNDRTEIRWNTGGVEYPLRQDLISINNSRETVRTSGIPSLGKITNSETCR